MPSQIEARLARLEGNAGSSRVVVVFEDDGPLVPDPGATVIVVRFVKPGDHHDDQASTR